MLGGRRACVDAVADADADTGAAVADDADVG